MTAISGPLALLAAIGWIDAIGRSLREAFFMFWATLWPLVLGFGLSGAVQAFVSQESLRTKLGDHRPPAVLRATGFGAASSSCSYAAAAMSKSLFARGADFVTTVVFMFASTNLVIELGLVLVVLIGWQFAVGEYVGGVVMIALLAAVGGTWFNRRSVAGARSHLEVGTGTEHEHQHGPAGGQPDAETRWTRRARTKSGWADASAYTMADLGMVRRELLIGYTVAGFLAVLVPDSWWHALFLEGHGVWTSIWNALVGPFVAVIAFVCSIGNVPLAAALWEGGVSFGGVIAFVFADLITFPLLLIYRRYYGTAMTLRMLVGFWAVMSTAGLVTEGVFRAAGIVPTHRPTVVEPTHFAWNYTTYLNLVALVAFGALVYAYRHRDRWRGDQGVAHPHHGGPPEDRQPAPAVGDGDTM